jgi:hypothetical protein
VSVRRLVGLVRIRSSLVGLVARRRALALSFAAGGLSRLATVLTLAVAFRLAGVIRISSLDVADCDSNERRSPEACSW